MEFMGALSIVMFANVTTKCSLGFHTISSIVQSNFIFFISLNRTKVLGFGGLLRVVFWVKQNQKQVRTC